MENVWADLKKHAVEIINYEKKEMLLLTEGNWITTQIYDAGDRKDESNDEESDVKKFQGNAVVFDDVDDDCYNHFDGDNNDDELDTRKFHGNAAETEIHVDNVDDKELSSIKFHGNSKNYGRACDHYHYAGT